MSARLLLVEDEPGLRQAVQAYLVESDFIVDVASNAKEGWEKLRQNSPQLVITDIMMPQVDGYEFLKQMRQDVNFKHLPVIFLTAKGLTKDRIYGFEAGCDAYISKPFDPDELITIVKNLLERRAVLVEKHHNKLDAIENELVRIRKQLDQLMGGQSAIAQTLAPAKIDLTPREQSVLDLLATGLMNKEIARSLGTSIRNVEKYVSRLFGKTGTNSRTELVRYALEHRLTH
jgi:DNA-binding NarL/FixJ family response regulator